MKTADAKDGKVFVAHSNNNLCPSKAAPPEAAETITLKCHECKGYVYIAALKSEEDALIIELLPHSCPLA